MEKGKCLAILLLFDISFQLAFCAIEIGFAASYSAVLPAVLPVSMLVACFVGLLGVRWKKQWMLWSFSFMSFLWFLFCLFLDLIYSGALTDLMPWDTTSMQVGFGGYITTFFQDEQGGGGGSNTGAQVTASLVIYSLAGFLAILGAILASIVQNKYIADDDILLTDETGLPPDYTP